jgi:transposase
MMGRRSPQDQLFATDRMYLDDVGRDTLYGYLAQNRQHLFRDEDFAALYCADNGRTSVPPSLAISILFLRAYEGVSFAEAIERTKYDLRWKVALGLEMEEEPMQKSALQEFEAKLVLQEMGEALLQKSIEEARRAGYLQSRKIRVGLDTTPILGKGAVKDTYNLLAEGMVQLARRLAEGEGESAAAWAERQGLSRYLGSSLKGEAAIDWDDKKQRAELLTTIVQDARRLLGLAEVGEKAWPEQAESLGAAAALLRRLIAQDVEEKPEGGCQIKEGTEKDRVVSVSDPEMRHGRKSASQRFNGHKAGVAVDLKSQLIGAVGMLAGNAGDQEKALELVHQSERVMEVEVEETVGDCAYGGGPTRRAFADEERVLTAKVPVSSNGDCFPKSEFVIDLEKREVRCPAGQTTSEYHSQGKGRGGRFVFAAATCQACPLRSRCVRGQGPRTIAIQAEEKLQQQARVHNQTEAGRRSLRERVVVEHRIARLVQLGIRKSRYGGRTKTGLQVVMAAVVANVSLVAGYCQRRAQQGIGAAEKGAAELAKSFGAAVLSLWERYLSGAGPVWV